MDEAKEQAAKKMIEILTKYQAGGEKDFSFPWRFLTGLLVFTRITMYQYIFRFFVCCRLPEGSASLADPGSMYLDPGFFPF